MDNTLFKKLILATTLMLGIFEALALGTSANPSADESNVLALNTLMFEIYDKEHAKFKARLMNEVPVIVARFSGAGGHLTLYRPGKPPLVAPETPLTYQLAKSVGHSVLVAYEMSGPYVKNSTTDKDWQPEMKLAQAKVATALSSLDGLDVSNSDKQIFRGALTIINTFLQKCLSKGSIKETDLDAYAKAIKPYIPKLIQIGAGVQVSHQMAVIASWKKLLGKDWDKTFAITNTIYVSRQNNMIFSMLAEFMGKDAINHRLFLFETTSFTTTDEDMLDLWSRVMSDRNLSDTMFGDHYLMDSELIANGGRQIIIDQAAKYGLPNILPDLEPYNSTEWPWRHNPNAGSGPGSLDQVKN